MKAVNTITEMPVLGVNPLRMTQMIFFYMLNNKVVLITLYDASMMLCVSLLG